MCAFPLQPRQLPQAPWFPDLGQHQKHLEGSFPDCWAPPPEFLTQYHWGEARAFAFLASSQVMLMGTFPARNEELQRAGRVSLILALGLGMASSGKDMISWLTGRAFWTPRLLRIGSPLAGR